LTRYRTEAGKSSRVHPASQGKRIQGLPSC